MLIFDAIVIGVALLFVIAGLRAGRAKPLPPRGTVAPPSTNGQPAKKKPTRMIDTRRG